MPKHPTWNQIRGTLFAPALPVSSSILSLTGVQGANRGPVAEIKIENNQLNFLDGKVVFDFEERFRWGGIRGNNYDFNDAVNALADDNWFLQRVRPGLTVKQSDDADFGYEHAKITF